MKTVQDLMTRPAISVRPETPLKHVARLLVGHGISGLPVVDEVGHVIGVVSEADFLVKEQDPEMLIRRPLARILGESKATRAQTAKINAQTAGEAMTSPAVTILPTRRIAEAATKMTTNRFNRLPVVDESGRLLGIVTRADLVRAFVRTDADLARSIREDVLLRNLWLDPLTFQIEVQEGRVLIRGHVERWSTAEMVERTVALVPGVVDVRSLITWSINDSDLRPQALDLVLPFAGH
ncbi:MAG TPA: CBS domain-containing protein [Candidatus Limnocylindrales bacterium]|nr:CBS domain-containing protein [Candidatus Limnocylindrales bacterium]